MSTFGNYLKEKKEKKERIKVYLISYGAKQKMLSGLVVDFDEDSIRLDSQECLVERGQVISYKPDDGK